MYLSGFSKKEVNFSKKINLNYLNNLNFIKVDSKRFPDTICDGVKQTRFYPSGRIDLHSCQFSWYCDGKKDEPLQHEYISYERSFELAVNFIADRPIDVTEGSTHYHNTKVKPFWTKSLDKIVQIEAHIFYKQ